MPITIDIQRELVEGLIPLKLHVTWRLLRKGRPFDEVLNAYVDIYRYLSLYDGKVTSWGAPEGWRDEQWEGILERFREILRVHAAEETSLSFEREGFELLRPLLEPELQRAVDEWPRVEDCPYGFFSYELSDLPQFPEHSIMLHFSNPFAPASPFADPQERIRELQRLVADAKRAHPDVTHAATGSWLCSFKPLLDFFPPEWAASAVPVDVVYPGHGLWGQFYDRRGGFHRKNAEHLRRTGEVPYPPVNCQCRIDALEAHLAACRKG